METNHKCVRHVWNWGSVHFVLTEIMYFSSSQLFEQKSLVPWGEGFHGEDNQATKDDDKRT